MENKLMDVIKFCFVLINNEVEHWKLIMSCLYKADIDLLITV